MDPLSITTSVLRITGSCVGAAKQLWDIRTAWKFAPATVSSLCSQLKLTAASLSQIQSLLLQDSDILLNRPELRDTFDTTLTSCLVLSTWLDKYMQKITKGLLGASRATWKTKFKTLWNEHEVKELSGQLQTQQGAISMLVGLLQVDSMSEIRQILRHHQELLQQIAKNTRDTRRTHAVDAPASIFSTDDDSQSMLSQLKDVEQDETFETVILSSRVYSQATTGILGSAPDASDDACTIMNQEPADHDTQAPENNSTSISVPSTVSPPTFAGLILHDPSIRVSVEKLGVVDIYAIAMYDHDAQSEEELSFTESQRIYDLQKCSVARYRGKVKSDLPDVPEAWGCFDRNKAGVVFQLRQPLKARALVDGRNLRHKDELFFEKDDILNINYIHHAFWWRWKVRLQNKSRTEVKQSGRVWICDLGLDRALEMDIDRMLQFSSCPMPGLSSIREVEKIRDILRTGTDHEILALIAHCSSLEELRTVARIWKEWYEDRAAQGFFKRLLQ